MPRSEYGSVSLPGSRRSSSSRGPLSACLDHVFHLEERGTTVWKEVRAGTATFLTMCYVVIVNARVVGDSSPIPASDVMLGTAISSALGCFICGLFGNLPFALAPGLGLSAYMSVSLANAEINSSSVRLGVSGHNENHQPHSDAQAAWKGSLATCAVAGMIQMLMSYRLSPLLMRFTPKSIQVGTVVGMGLLLAFVALEQIQFIQRVVPVGLMNGSTTAPLLQLGPGVRSTEGIIAFVGLLVLLVLSQRRVPGNVVIAIVLNTFLSIHYLHSPVPEAVFAHPKTGKAFGAWNFHQLDSSSISPIVSFILVAVFDIAGVLVGLARVSGLPVDEDEIPHGASWAFFAAGLSTVVGALFGSTPVIVHLESAAGLSEGGKTGLTACVCALWFSACVFLSPLLVVVPSVATTPVLMFIGSLMMDQITFLDDSLYEKISSYVTLTFIPFTFSVPNGVVSGFLVRSCLYVMEWVIKLFVG